MMNMWQTAFQQVMNEAKEERILAGDSREQILLSSTGQALVVPRWSVSVDLSGSMASALVEDIR